MILAYPFKYFCPLTIIPIKTELLRVSRTNFSESLQILVHLKVVRLFVESVLRYGLPANYLGIVIKVCQCYLGNFACVYFILCNSLRPRRPRRQSIFCRRNLRTSALDRMLARQKARNQQEAVTNSLGNTRRLWSKNFSTSSCLKFHGSLTSILTHDHFIHTHAKQFSDLPTNVY